MGRYNFAADELQRRATLSGELRKKFQAQRAAAGDGKGKKGKGKETKKVEEAPKIDLAAIRAQKRDRRHFIGAVGAFATAMLVTAGGTQRFLFPRVLFEPPSNFDAGPPDNFLPNQPVFFKENRTWIIRATDRIYALSGRCTHLGCTPAWLPSDGKFKCPCHGSGFRATGVNFEGPAPRALERFRIALSGGRLQVDTSKLFLFEKGDWEKPDSFVLV